MKTLEGALVAQNMKVALVAARFNEFITAKLIGGALDGLKRHGVRRRPSTWPGSPAPLRSPWWPASWQTAESTTP